MGHLNLPQHCPRTLLFLESKAGKIIKKAPQQYLITAISRSKNLHKLLKKAGIKIISRVLSSLNTLCQKTLSNFIIQHPRNNLSLQQPELKIKMFSNLWRSSYRHQPWIQLKSLKISVSWESKAFSTTLARMGKRSWGKWKVYFLLASHHYCPQTWLMQWWCHQADFPKHLLRLWEIS